MMTITNDMQSVQAPVQHASSFQNEFAGKKDVEGDSYLKNRAVNQLADKLATGGIFTKETSRILANNILNGSVDVFV